MSFRSTAGAYPGTGCKIIEDAVRLNRDLAIQLNFQDCHPGKTGIVPELLRQFYSALTLCPSKLYC